jgi:hypothetical protein
LISDSSILQFGYGKYISGTFFPIGVRTNPANGVDSRGMIVDLKDFEGEMSMIGNTINDVTARISS